MGQSSSWKPAPWKLGETAHLTLNLPCTWPCGTMCCSWTRVCPPSLEPRASSLARTRFADVWESSRVGICQFPEGWRPWSSRRLPRCLQVERRRVCHARILNAGQPAAARHVPRQDSHARHAAGRVSGTPSFHCVVQGTWALVALEQQAQVRHVCNKRMPPPSSVRLSCTGSSS